MKVVCINNGLIITDWGEPSIAPELTEGMEYTVVKERLSLYVLAEVNPSPGYGGFAKQRFIKCSSIDETTFERNYNKELV